MSHYYAVCEPDDAGGFWISFPGRDGITSAAASASQIVFQAQDALETVLMYEGTSADLPPSIEDGARPAGGSERLRQASGGGDPVRAGQGSEGRVTPVA